MTIRLDKYLANLWLISRRQVWNIIKSWNVLIDWQEARSSDQKIHYWQHLTYGDLEFEIKEFVYILLNKKKGYISSDIDEFWHLSYRHLLADCPYVNLLHVAGRLDEDTTWLLLCSNDGKFIHNIIHPKKTVWKIYEVILRDPYDPGIESVFQKGVKLDDGYICMPAQIVPQSDFLIHLTIYEWKFHQVKRMMQAVWNEVVELNRLSIGEYKLWELQPWERRHL